MSAPGLALLAAALAAPIVDGELEEGYPSVVSLGVPWGDSPIHVCTGNLITPRVILSAAHCSDDIPVEAVVQFGRAYVGARIDEAEHELLFADAIAHPEFVLNRTSPTEPFTVNDVSVLVLEDEAPMAPTPLRLRAMNANDLGVVLTSVGFGATDAEGRGAGVKRSAELVIGDLFDQHIVAYTADSPGGGQICGGDSGGPQLVAEGGRDVQWGIHSFGDSQCAVSSGSTRTDLMGEWILDQVEAVHGERDLCAINAWYGDGICDGFCDEVDPDCLPEDEGDTGLGEAPKGTCAHGPPGAGLIWALALAWRRRSPGWPRGRRAGP